MVNADVIGMSDNPGNSFKAKFIFLLRGKIFSMSFCVFNAVAPKQNFLIRRKNVGKFRIFSENRVYDIFSYSSNRNIAYFIRK